MKNIFQKIIDICEENTDTEGTLSEIKVKAKNRVIRYEWEEKYGIKLPDDCNFAERSYYSFNDYCCISYYKDGVKDRDSGGGRYISWSEGDKQPIDEWLYQVHFSTGAYIFGEDYDGQQQLFQEFFEELRTYKPDYEDLHNSCLYWKAENAKEIMSQFQNILKKYRDKNTEELKTRKIAKLEEELTKLKS
jgi:hypothetical protein